jgi:rSAM/selenodomain-associated transferase 1
MHNCMRCRLMVSNRLIIFVKAPRPGFVKTRLASAIGTVEATEAYRRLVETLLERLANLTNVELRYSPDDALAEIQPWLRSGWEARPQTSGDLGQRLNSAFSDTFRAGAEHVAIIGSDCPDVAPADIQNAWTALLTHDVVLGPATDGGYWLIGLRQSQPLLFHDMVWSTATVLTETLRRIQAAQLSACLLQQLSDIDTVADWSRFLQADRAN